MKNPMQGLYSNANKKAELHFVSCDSQIDWTLLSDQFCDKFGLNQGVPVGKTNATGFEFELNYINYWLVLPVVTVTQNGKDVTVTQLYDSKLRYAQFFAITILLFNIVIFSFVSVGMVIDSSFELGAFLGGVFATSMCLGLLGMILTLRGKLWMQSLEKAEALLKIVGVKPAS